MKKIYLLAFLLFVTYTSLNAQQMGVAIYGAPTLTKIKYNDFNTFADSYNTYNGYNLQGFDKMKVTMTYGADIFVKFMYFGLYYNKFSASSNAVQVSANTERHFDLVSKSYMTNVGWNLGKGPISISPYMPIGLNRTFLDVYMKYNGADKYYGNYKLDGYYTGLSGRFGFGLKLNFFLKPFFASLGFSKIYTIFGAGEMMDFGTKSGYDSIATDWGTYQSGNSWDYTGNFMSSNHKDFTIQLSLGAFIGSTGN